MPAPLISRSRRLTQALLLGAAVASFVWVIVLYLTGGFDASLFGIRIRSNNPDRVLLVGSVALSSFILAGGWIRVRLPWRPAVRRLRGLSVAIARRPGWIAGALAVAMFAMGLAYSARTATDSDIYGYMSQADLWLDGRLKIAQPWMADVPWPEKRWSFSPLGYRPAPGADEMAIVPTYSPGVPMLLAAAKLIGGQCGLFTVIPLLGALSVFVTYRLGRRLGAPVEGLVAAWLMTTSPPVLGVLMDPLSDVPAMAVWSLALLCALGRGVVPAGAAGLLVTLGTLIRPNLVVLAAPIGLWFFVRRDVPATHARRTRLLQAGVFAAGASIGVIATAWLNDYLYGSPLLSGYGRLEDLFAWRHFLPNLRSYVSWYAESQHPIAMAGIAALAIPLRWIWPGVTDRSVFGVIGLYVALLWGQYAAYLQFDSWGYLRFLLPSWPFLMLGVASVLLAMARLGRGRAAPVVAVAIAVVVVAIGIRNLEYAKRHGVFDERQAVRHEAVLGPLIQQHTDENSVIVTIQRSGSVRYYSGRVTLRYDYLPAETLDRDVAWLAARGRRVFALMDARETAEFKQKFAGQRTLAAFDRPVFVYEPAAVSLVDLSRPADAATARPSVIKEAPPDRWECR